MSALSLDLIPHSALPTPHFCIMAQFQLGGQALIEGVMMRGPSHVGAAVRRADGTIQTRVEPFDSILKKKPFLNIFLLRGIFALVEMMRLGTDYLRWSSGLALEDEEAKQAAIAAGSPDGRPAPASAAPAPAKTSPVVAAMFLLTALLSFGLGALIFVAVPNFVAHFVFKPMLFHDTLIHDKLTHPQTVVLTLIEGVVKLCIFVAYVWLIGQRKQIRRLFAYHGAEHKVVYAVENKRPLTPAGARPFDTPHPRCGTGFALLTIFVGIFVYSFLPWYANHFLRVGLRLLMLPLVAGISYEVLKATVNPRLGALANLVITPGMWLQRLTTSQPDDAQLEVACRAMQVLLEKEAPPEPMEKSGAEAMVNEEEAIV